MPNLNVPLTRSALLSAALGLVACAPTNASTTQPVTYQAQAAEVEQAIRDVAASFAQQPGFGSLVIAPSKSVNGQVFLTSPIRVTERGNVVNAVNVLDERELVFTVSGKSGLTTVDYRMKGQVEQQLKTVMNALDQRFTRAP